MADSLRPTGTNAIFGRIGLCGRASRSSGVSRAKAGGEGSRTPVLKTVVPNFYMRSRSSYRVSLADRRATLTLVATK
jgi:hypothetical protein